MKTTFRNPTVLLSGASLKLPPVHKPIPIYTREELAELSRRIATNVPLTEKDIIAVFNILERTYEGIFTLSWDLMTNQSYIHYHGVKFHTFLMK